MNTSPLTENSTLQEVRDYLAAQPANTWTTETRHSKDGKVYQCCFLGHLEIGLGVWKNDNYVKLWPDSANDLASKLGLQDVWLVNNAHPKDPREAVLADIDRKLQNLTT